MKLTILGSGTISPRVERNAAGAVITTAGATIMVDIGPGSMRRMTEAAIDPRSIDAILLTHFHPDHVSDLVPFLFAADYAFSDPREEPFHVIGPTGLELFYRGLVAVFQSWIVPKEARLKLMERPAGERDSFDLRGLTIRSGPVAHEQNSLCYRIEAEDRVLVISGDTGASADLVDMAKDADLLVCECSHPDGELVPYHMTPSEAAQHAALAGAKSLMLTHFYPRCDEVDVVAQASPHFAGPILAATDLLTVEI